MEIIMRKDAKLIKAVSTHNGSTYTISEERYYKNPRDWKVEMTAPQVDESLNEITYDDLKLILKARGVDFKGNASKKELIELLDNSEG